MSRVFVGHLPGDVTQSELEGIFAPHGRIAKVDIKGPRDSGGAFAFVEYEDERDAREAVDKESGATFAGSRLRVEIANSNRERGGGFRDRFDDRYGGGRDRYDDRYGRGGGGGGRYDDRYDDRRGGPRSLGPSPFGPSRKTDYEVIVSGLEPTMSWQDLKDHFRSFKLEVTHTDVDRRGGGSASFASRADMEDALRQVDNTEMRNMRGTCMVRIDPADSGGRGGGRDDRDRGYDDRGYDDRGYDDRGGRDDRDRGDDRGARGRSYDDRDRGDRSPVSDRHRD